MSALEAKKLEELPPRLTMKEIHERYPEALVFDCEHMPHEETGDSTARVAGYGQTLEEAARMAHAAGFIDDEALRFWLFWPQQRALMRAKGFLR